MAGLLFGHWLTYAVLVPDEHARQTFLSATGHAYLGGADRIATTMAIVSLAVLVLRRLAHASGSTWTWVPVARRLAAVQVSAFTLLEVSERLSAHASLHDLAHVLPLGLVAQLLVAGACATLLVLLGRLVDRAAERLGTGLDPTRPTPAGIVVPRARAFVPLPRRTASAPRAPPAFV